jgi:transposase
MPQNFVACDREQELLLPPSLREWLPEDHLAWLVLEAVGELDLTAFYRAYRDDGHGRAALDPAMMVALLLYAYAIGVRSSRAIERRCREDVAFRVIAANQVPDHATIARFRARHEHAIAELFAQVLGLCARAGLVQLGVVAVDGTKIAAAATHHATRSYGRSRARSSSRRPSSTPLKTSFMATHAAMSFPRSCRPRRVVASGCARPSMRWTPNVKPTPSRSRVTAASGCVSAGAGSSRTTGSSVALSPSTPPGLKRGSPATDRAG